MHEIKKYTNDVFKYIGISDADRLKVIIVDALELNGSVGRYDAVNNILFVTQLEKEKQLYMIVHESLHLKDCLYYRSLFGDSIKSNEDDISYMSKKAKKTLDKMGRSLQNVREISNYAFVSYLAERYDEVYIEIRTKEVCKRVE